MSKQQRKTEDDAIWHEPGHDIAVTHACPTCGDVHFFPSDFSGPAKEDE